MNASSESCPLCGAKAYNEETNERYCSHAVLDGYLGEYEDLPGEWLPHEQAQSGLKEELMMQTGRGGRTAMTEVEPRCTLVRSRRYV